MFVLKALARVYEWYSVYIQFDLHGKFDWRTVYMPAFTTGGSIDFGFNYGSMIILQTPMAHIHGNSFILSD